MIMKTLHDQIKDPVRRDNDLYTWKFYSGDTGRLRLTLLPANHSSIRSKRLVILCMYPDPRLVKQLIGSTFSMLAWCQSWGRGLRQCIHTVGMKVAWALSLNQYVVDMISFGIHQISSIHKDTYIFGTVIAYKSKSDNAVRIVD
jgi:hypothetical protein